jgi:hypothetical protein
MISKSCAAAVALAVFTSLIATVPVRADSEEEYACNPVPDDPPPFGNGAQTNAQGMQEAQWNFDRFIRQADDYRQCALNQVSQLGPDSSWTPDFQARADRMAMREKGVRAEFERFKREYDAAHHQ